MQILPVVFDFLKKIEQNNDREWFSENKNLYESALANVQDLVSELIKGISSFDSSIGNQEAKKCIYRIYRDVRFSPDKRPYKTHFGAYIVPGGKQSNNAGYYIHIQDNMSMVSGGIWCPESQLLKKIREEIYYAPEELVQIVENKEFKAAFGGLMEQDSLKKPPRNYPADFQHIKLLQYRHYCVEKFVTNADVLEEDYVKNCIKTCKIMYPFITYLNMVVKI